jgi:hypothetical protein
MTEREEMQQLQIDGESGRGVKDEVSAKCLEGSCDGAGAGAGGRVEIEIEGRCGRLKRVVTA